MKDKIIIYTDGSCDVRTRLGGYGAVLSYKEHVKEIFGGFVDTTISRMEITACIKALEELKRSDIPVDIYSDSAYVVNCFLEEWYINWRKNGWKNSKKKPVENQDLWIRLIELYESHGNVVFNKVKGHVGIELNEVADGLALKGRMEVTP